MKTKILNLLGLATRARKIILGEEFVLKAMRNTNLIVFLASDAGGNITKKIINKAHTFNCTIIDIFTTDELSKAIGKENRKVMIIEGILIMTNPLIREMFDIKIYVHADSDERLIRRLKRDINERGRDLSEVLSRYQTTLKPMHDQFIEPTKEYADIIIPNNKYNTVAVDIVRTIINEKLG